MVVAAHDRRDRQRRHAVPRRLGHRSDQCQQPRRPSDHPSDPDGDSRPRRAAVRHSRAERCRDTRILDGNRDHIRSGSGGPRPVDANIVGCPRRCPRGGDRLAAYAPGLARGRRRIDGAAAPSSRRRTGRSSGFPALARRRQLYLSRLPRIFLQWSGPTRIRAAWHSARRGPPDLRGIYAISPHCPPTCRILSAATNCWSSPNQTAAGRFTGPLTWMPSACGGSAQTATSPAFASSSASSRP